MSIGSGYRLFCVTIINGSGYVLCDYRCLVSFCFGCDLGLCYRSCSLLIPIYLVLQYLLFSITIFSSSSSSGLFVLCCMTYIQVLVAIFCEVNYLQPPYM